MNAQNPEQNGSAEVPSGSEPQGAEPTTPSFSDQLTAAARKSGLGTLAEGEGISSTALLAAIGGVRGIFEAIVPGLLFVIVYSISQNLPLAAGISVGIAVIATVARLLGKATVTAALTGLIGVVLSAVLAIITNRPENNFLIGFYTNAAYAAALIISILVRWPIIGVITGFLMGDGTAWRRDRRRRRILTWLTWLWVGMFIARIAVQLPLYWAENVTGLGIARVAMGLPLYAPILVLTVLVIRALWRSGTDSDTVTKKIDAP